jgi:hypothetical protein
MKKILGIIIGIIVLLGIGLRIFGKYNSNNILSSEASFEVFINNSTLDIDNYFQLPKGTIEKEQYSLICKLPVEVQGFKRSYVPVRTDIENIDCNAKFEKEKYIQYEPFELKGTDFELILVRKNANLMTLNSPLGEKIIFAKKILSYDYSKGKVNRLIISESGLNEYCK